MFSTGHVAIWCLILCGFANSIMYPTIFALGIAELGPLTSKGSGVITIGNVGGAVIPPLFGLIADKTGYPARVSADHRRLSVHDFLRSVGIQAGAQGCGLGFLQHHIHQALRRAGGLAFLAFARTASAEIGSAAAPIGAAAPPRRLPQTETSACTASGQQTAAHRDSGLRRNATA